MRDSSEAATALTELLKGAVSSAFPGCVALVWRGGALVYHQAHGELARHPAVSGGPVTRTTAYDLASLTKVLATTTLAALAVADGRVELDSPVPEQWEQACPRGTMRDLLEHCAGPPAHREFFTDVSVGDRTEMMRRVATTPPEYRRREQAVYSDLGFLILGRWLESLWGETLDVAFQRRVSGPLGLSGDIGYGVDSLQAAIEIAPTEVYDPRLHPAGAPSWFGVRGAASGLVPFARGVVHDDNAFVMGGIAGHAGLFGTGLAVLELGLAWLFGTLPGLDIEIRDLFWAPSTVAGSTRCCGWDGTAPDGSGATGDALSPRAVGHLGFTGTSLWIDPAPPGGVYVLLSNRVHPTRENLSIREVRRAFHRLAAGL